MNYKKLFSLILSFVMVFSVVSLPLSAANIDTPIHEEEIEEYVASCPGASKHLMVLCGTGSIFSGPYGNKGTTILSIGSVSQCCFCGLYMCSQNWPGVVQRCLGMYKVTYYDFDITSKYGFYNGLTGTNYSLTQDSYIAGFEFD